MARDKTSVILYGNMLKAIAKLPAENCLEMMQAIAAFVDGEHYEFSNPILAAWFSDMVETFKRDSESFKATCVKRSELGRLGGLKRAENMRKTQEADVDEVEGGQVEVEALKQTQANSSKPKQIQANSSKLKLNQAKLSLASKIEANQAETETETYTETDILVEKEKKEKEFLLDDFIAAGKDPSVALSEAEAKNAYDYYAAQGFVRSNGRPITQLAPLLRQWKRNVGKFDPPPNTAEAGIDQYSLERAFEFLEGHFLGDYDDDPRGFDELKAWANKNGIFGRLKNRNDKLYQHVFKTAK